MGSFFVFPYTALDEANKNDLHLSLSAKFIADIKPRTFDS